MAQDRPIGNMKFGIGFDGFDESLNTLDKLNKALKQSESSMKATMSTFDKAGASAEDLSRKQQGLIDTTELQAKKIQLLEKRREEYIQTYGKESKQVANVTTQINTATVKYNKLSKELDSTKQAYILASAGVDKYASAIKDNEKAMNDEIKAFKEAGDKAGELEAKQRGLTKQAELTEQAIESQKQAINKMAQEFGESSTQVAQAQTKLEEFKRSAKNTDTRLDGVTSALSELKKEASNVDDKVDKAGDALEEAGKQGNKAEAGFKNATKEFSALATGLAVSISTKALDMATEAANALKESFNEVVEASNRFQGKMGITKGESKQFLNFANELVKSGMVDSLEEAQEAITQVYQTAGKKVTPEGLKQLTKYAISFSKTFDTDVNETMRGASRMMENFGISAEEAFDLLTAGAQKGLNQSNELADNMAEYSQLFGQMGFTAEETFSLLEAGLDGGAYNLDKVNDLIKEMGISLTDGRFEENADMFSESTRNLFNEWKNGKATQGEVVKAMMNDFANMEGGYDALNRAGTVWSALGEDNSLKVIKAMAGASTSFGETKGSAEDLNNTMTNTTAWEAFTNGVKGTVNSIAIWAQEFTGGMTEPIENFFNNTLPNAMKTLDFFFFFVSNFISNLKDIIGKMWSGQDTVSDQHILNMMGFSWESIWALDDFITQVKEKGEVLTQYIKGFWQLFTGDEATQMQGYSLLRSLGMSQEDIAALETAKENIMKAFDSVKEVIINLLEDGLDKMIQAWKDLVQIWQDVIAPDLLPLFQQFADWLSRLTGDLAVISGALDNFGGSGKRNSNIIIEAFSILWETLKIKLGLIMATIETTMIIISSTIKIWSDIFKGDWEGAWNGIKGMYDRISDSIKTNLKNTFLGDMIKSIEDWNIRTTKAFTGWITDISIKFGTWLTNMKTWFKNLPGELAEKFKSGGSTLANAFKSVFNGALRAIGKPVNGIIKGASWVLEKLGAEPLKEWDVPQYAKGTPEGGHPINGPMMVNDGRGAETVITPDGRAFIPKGRNVVLNAPKGTHVLTAEETAQLQGSKAPKYRYKKGTNFFGNMWDSVKNVAGNVGNTLKNVVGDVWDFISDPGALARKVLGGLDVLGGLTKYPLEVGKGILSKATSALTEKITDLFSSGNLDTSIGTNGVYKYLADVAKSVMKKFPGFMVTSGYREGDAYSHGKRNAIDIALPGVTGGSPRYTEAANYAFDKFASKIGYVITNGKVRDRSGQSGTGIHDDWRPWPAGDHYDHVHLNGIKDPQNTQISGDSVGGSGVERWRNVAIRALKMTGQYSTANLNALLNQMRTESNGNPKAINLWDPNAMKGTPSKGLMQVIDPTFRQYAMPGFNSNIYDPLSNILASIRYALATYGSLTNAYRGVGYENGGIITKEHIARVGEGNKEEVVIPLTGSGLKRSRAMQLLAYANEKLNKQSTSTTVTTSNSNSDSNLQLIIALMQQQNELLVQLLEKNTDVLIDGKSLNRELQKINKTEQRNTNRALGLI
jgi:SLT domain-containing protein/phage-related minor tail protein|nr:MAG TPA: minor tail protein [Caudoviricetes sp.]